MFFVEKDDEATRDVIKGPKLSPLSKEKANFVLVVRPVPVELPAAEAKPRGPTITSGGKSEKKEDASADGADATQPVTSPIPVSKLSLELWAAYGVTSANTVVLTDWFGNEKGRYSRIPGESALIKAIDGVAAQVASDAKSLDSDLQKLEKFVAANDDPKAIKQAMKIFKRGLIGHDAVAKTETHYGKLLENGRVKIKSAEDAGDLAGVRALRMVYRDTEIEGEVNAAIARVQASVSK